MTEQINLVPKRRFKEFQNTSPWEQRKLGEMGKTITGLSGKTKEDFGHGEAKFVTYMNVFSNPIANLDGTESVEIDSKQSEVIYGDVFFTTSSETPEEVGMSSVWLGNTANVYLNSFCFGYRPTVKFDPYYLAFMLRSPSVRKKLMFLAQGISRYNISKNKVMEMPVPVPSIDEQERVGEFFKNLDHLIALHQRKLEKMKALKSAYLSEMFPVEGEREPKRRFAGFTGAWEQRAVSDLADRYDNLRIPITASDRVAGSTPYYGANGIQDYVEGYTHDGEFILVAEDGANDLQNYPFHYVNGKVWVNNHAHVLQAKSEIADNIFLMNALKHTNIEPYLVGGGRAKLNADVMMKISIQVPKLAEQKLVGAFFANLDHLITLHKRKLEKLQNMKNAYLNEMFV